MAERYCKAEDLIIGDLDQGDNDNPDRFVNFAADEMDAALGQVFVIPLSPALTSLPAHVQLLLKTCNARIASGWFILDAGANGQADGLDQYGAYLLNEGRAILNSIVNRHLEIGAVLIASAATGDAPLITQGDTTSGLDAYYAFVSGDPYTTVLNPAPWRPGITA